MNEREEQKPWEKIPIKRVDSVGVPVKKEIVGVPSYVVESEIEQKAPPPRINFSKSFGENVTKDSFANKIGTSNPVVFESQKDEKFSLPVEKKKKNWLKFVVGGVLLVAISFGAAYLTFSQSEKESPQTVPSTEEMTFEDTEEEVTALLKKIESHMLLPQGNDFVVYTVTDLEPLKNQDFFRNATVGDKVVIWAGARKAILYSPSKDKIIEVSMVDLMDQAATSTPTQ